MREYICLRCNLNCGRFKTHLRNHFRRKKLCNVINYNISCDILIEKLDKNVYIEYYNELKESDSNGYSCPYCNKTYKYQSGLCKHKSNCKKKDLVLLNGDGVRPPIIQNIYNNNQTNININVNSFGKEEYDIKKITKQLNFVLGYSNFNGNKLQFKDRIDNMISNYNIIFDHLYDNPNNHNFDIVNKKNKICKIKDSDTENFIHIHFDELVEKIFNIVYKIFDLSILDFEFNNDNISLEHYKEFQEKLVARKNKYIQQYYSSSNAQEKNNIKQKLYIFYKGFQDILFNIKDKIVLKTYDF